eukprot:CAMPEP_0184019922 /NCGR_PEP_ID=MMETSP0954-20121128/9044_1 /TAXON_ID=627963 /ORGANISM="Aplanochytrium sp, Strain PBS07" /LENGTH=35 /DNA_ID= /DNA_START= /DNA_END= /DNA_ORIENTATION=
MTCHLDSKSTNKDLKFDGAVAWDGKARDGRHRRVP